MVVNRVGASSPSGPSIGPSINRVEGSFPSRGLLPGRKYHYRGSVKMSPSMEVPTFTDTIGISVTHGVSRHGVVSRELT